VAKRRLIRLAILAGIVIAACACSGGERDAGTRASATSAQSNAALVARLDGLVSAFKGGVGVWVGDPATSAPLYAHRADEQVVAASLYKLAVLMEAERRIDAGTLRSDQLITIQPEDLTGEGSMYEAGTDVTVEQALEAMTTASDNGTALALWRLLGDDGIRSTLVRAGIPDFRLDIVGATMATPRAIGAIFTRLAKRELVSRAASERMVARLQRQTINDRLPAGLPDGVVVAHKTGNLPGLTHDAGIIVTPSGPRIVVVMTWDSDEGAANALIADIGAAVYRAATDR